MYTTDPEWQDSLEDDGVVVDTRTGGMPPTTPGPAPVPGAPLPPRPRRRRRRWPLLLLLPLIPVLVWGGMEWWAVSSAWDAVNRVDAMPDGERPAAGKGKNFLFVGSDSVAGLTEAERRRLQASSPEGARSDTIILLHVPESGDPTLVSIPRDSYVSIPGYRKNKINAAYALGGPRLLVETVEANTNLRIDGYLETGYAGFVGLVDDLGGIEMCLSSPFVSKTNRLDLPAGCQEFTGQKALLYVRSRKDDPLGDLGRAKRQRQFLASVIKEVTTPSAVLNPFELKRNGTAVAGSLTIDQDDTRWEMLTVLRALRSVSAGQGRSVAVPASDLNYRTPAGSSVKWDDARAAALFEALRTDSPIPASVTDDGR